MTPTGAPTGDKQHGEDHYKTPSSVREVYPHLPDTIPFYRPKLGHTIEPGRVYAIRCNQGYFDMKAAFEGERAYVRNAILFAGTIVMHRCFQKQPIIIITDFESERIAPDDPRPLDAALDRAFLLETKRHRFDIPNLDDNVRYMVSGTSAAVSDFVSHMAQHTCIQTKKSHIEGTLAATAVMTPAQAQEAAKTVLVEQTDRILRSTAAKQQITMRKTGATVDELMLLGLDLQHHHSASVYLRSHGAIRVTFNDGHVQRSTIAGLRKKYPGYKIFPDTPLDAWGTDRRAPESEATKEAKAQGMVIARLEADYLPLPDRFGKISEALGATVLEIAATRPWNDGPMAALISFSSAAWVAAQKYLAAGPLEVDDAGAWQVTALRYSV